MDSENFDVRIFAKPNRKVYIAVNTLNEKTFASTSPLLQPRKSVIRTTDYGVGKSSLTYFELCCQKTKVVRQKRNAKQDYELAGSRNYGLMELQSHGTTDLRNKGIESFFTFCTFLSFTFCLSSFDKILLHYYITKGARVSDRLRVATLRLQDN